LSVVWSSMPGTPDPVLKKWAPSWAFHAWQCLGFTENGAADKKHLVSDSPVGENSSLMRGFWVHNWDFWFPPPCLCEIQSRWTDDLCMCGSHHEAWRRRCDGVGVIFWWHCLGFNQHRYHSILQRYAIPSGLRLVGLSFVFQQDSVQKHTSRLFDQEGEWWSVASDDLASTITRPLPNWDGLGCVGPQGEGKAANKCSAYVRTPSRLLENHSKIMKLVEGMPRVCKAVIKTKVGNLKNLKYILICLTLFLVTTWFHVRYFIVLMSSLLFNNAENSKNQEKPFNE
jgi:hypothetical protein